MKLFRLHITRIYGFFLLILGIGLNVTNISDQEVHHAAFTSWLGSQLKNDDSEALKKLDNLTNDKSELEDVIRKASEVVTSYADDFNLPVGSDDNEPDADQVFHLLLTQWNQFQHSEAGMSKAVLVETVKPQTILPNDGKLHQSNAVQIQNSNSHSTSELNDESVDFSSSSYFISPLSGGIAIGAP